MIFAGCTESKTEAPAAISTEVSYIGTNVDKVELFHFFGAKRCYSCVLLGDYAEESVNTYYKEELNSGRIVFKHIDMSLPENQEIVEIYGPTGSSLWIGIYDENGIYLQELIAPLYMLGSKTEFMGYLKEVIGQQI